MNIKDILSKKKNIYQLNILNTNDYFISPAYCILLQTNKKTIYDNKIKHFSKQGSNEKHHRWQALQTNMPAMLLSFKSTKLVRFHPLSDRSCARPRIRTYNCGS
ncbi:hypothetical protein DBR43_06415 [Pedobacter sp. KBW06]|nr:hypothetical protein DBR43_06415 [Pedobacter sp. KBW06]